jgi:hypothetical protein
MQATWIKSIAILAIAFGANAGRAFERDVLSPHQAVTEQSFQDVIGFVLSTFQPTLAAVGIRLDTKLRWSDPNRIASIVIDYNDEKHYTLQVNGGDTKTPSFTNDGLAQVVCHEIGHILGGSPGNPYVARLAVENQADYFAANVCLKRVFAKDPNIEIMAQINVPVSIQNKCESVYVNPRQVALCERIMMAGYASADDYRAYKKIKTPLSFDRAENAAKDVNLSYASPQCRLESAIAGALCEKGFGTLLDSNGEIRALNCERSQGFNLGVRPACWYPIK